ncbi:hypothetical protein EDC18_102418 [Natranaerovirga pectinivora]|uniref:Uncharacterized protein n=1 Tax=Natranaerovirga pectinivora TaxID=682400 RepID=A0A4R3MN29_9FIRM|nr:hypothetical protein [Natranaerovirga pectinivora]TCT16399.1 hypothetical protein EDC18_102418 [Natranaerovirga pectinivora]
MWFENKKTGLKWNITDKFHIDRLKNNSDYEVVVEKTETKPKSVATTKPKATTTKK